MNLDYENIRNTDRISVGKLIREAEKNCTLRVDCKSGVCRSFDFGKDKKEPDYNFLPEHDALVKENQRVLADKFLKSDYQPRHNTVAIGIPTYNCSSYIKGSLKTML